MENTQIISKIACWCSWCIVCTRISIKFEFITCLCLGNGKIELWTTIDHRHSKLSKWNSLPNSNGWTNFFDFVTLHVRFSHTNLARARAKKTEHILYVIFVAPFIKWQFRLTSLHTTLINCIERKSSNGLITFGNNTGLKVKIMALQWHLRCNLLKSPQQSIAMIFRMDFFSLLTYFSLLLN